MFAECLRPVAKFFKVKLELFLAANTNAHTRTQANEKGTVLRRLVRLIFVRLIFVSTFIKETRMVVVIADEQEYV